MQNRIMDENKIDPKNASTKCTTDVINNRMVRDPVSTEVLLCMVQKGRQALRSTRYTYDRFSQVLAQQINEQDYFPEPTCTIITMEGAMNMLTDLVLGVEEKNPRMSIRRQVDAYIDEVLRFLALKILFPSSTSAIPTLQLRPSKPIRHAWEALLLFPITCSKVCTAMGCDSATYIDLSSSQDAHSDDLTSTCECAFNDSLSAKMWEMECYQWTLVTYRKVYQERPPIQFWPMVQVSMKQGEMVWTETRDPTLATQASKDSAEKQDEVIWTETRDPTMAAQASRDSTQYSSFSQIVESSSDTISFQSTIGIDNLPQQLFKQCLD